MAEYTRYRLTDEGWEAFNRIAQMHEAELEKLRVEYNDPDYDEGWSVIDDFDHIKNIDDDIDLLIYGYEEAVISTLVSWAWGNIDSKYMFGYTYKQVISRISERGLLEVVN